MAYPKYKQKASRLEYFCIRFLYWIPLLIVGGIKMIILSIGIRIFSFINFLTVLFSGQKKQTFYELFEKGQLWTLKVAFYMAGASEERPTLTPF